MFIKLIKNTNNSNKHKFIFNNLTYSLDLSIFKNYSK